MKFGKEFTSKMVPEWHEAYMDYKFLKTLLKEIYLFKQSKKAAASSKPKRTLHRAFSGLVHLSKSPGNISSPDIENQEILVNSVSRDGEEKYETTFLKAEDEGAEYELVYFRKLDEELNKSVKFYRAKVEEVMEEAGVLNKQMDALIAFRIKVNDPQAMLDSAAEIDSLASDVAASTAEIRASTPSAARTRSVPMVTIEEEMSNHVWKSNESIDDKETMEAKPMSQDVQQHKPKNIINGIRPAQLEILNYVKMNNTTETPRSTIKGILNITSNETELRFNTQNLRKVELQLKRVFIQFYHKLRLLKSYRFLNTMAFAKIMKKYDKITSRRASKSYLKIVGKSCIGNPDEITKLMERVEVTFIKHFCNSNRDEAMIALRPKAKKERHRITFSTGFFVGCVLALILALVLIIRARNIIASKGTNQYMRTLFPLYSFFGFIILHMLMYAANIYFWRRYRVNYTFIFGFKEGTELSYREVLFLGFGFSVLAVASVLANLDMDMDPRTGDFKAFTELLPLGLLVAVVVILICPLNIIYRSSRFFLLTCVFHSICAPLYMVSFSDSFLADQLTSEVQAIRSLEYYICYYAWGDYKVRRDNCRTSDVFNTFYFIVAAIPYWLRLLQCLRRLCEEKHGMQALNGLKYFSTIIAISARTAFSLNRGSHWRIIAWITSAIAAVFGTYWDLVMDWGLLQRNSRNSWLRDTLLLPHKSIYFGAMVLNILLRLAWMETVLGLPTPFLHREALTVFVAILEIIRRGIWNFFRLENEHLHNVGKYCAIKSVPLPFNCDEDDIKDGYSRQAEELC